MMGENGSDRPNARQEQRASSATSTASRWSAWGRAHRTRRHQGHRRRHVPKRMEELPGLSPEESMPRARASTTAAVKPSAPAGRRPHEGRDQVARSAGLRAVVTGVRPRSARWRRAHGQGGRRRAAWPAPESPIGAMHLARNSADPAPRSTVAGPRAKAARPASRTSSCPGGAAQVASADGLPMPSCRGDDRFWDRREARRRALAGDADVVEHDLFATEERFMQLLKKDCRSTWRTLMPQGTKYTSPLRPGDARPSRPTTRAWRSDDECDPGRKSDQSRLILSPDATTSSKAPPSAPAGRRSSTTPPTATPARVEGRGREDLRVKLHRRTTIAMPYRIVRGPALRARARGRDGDAAAPHASPPRS